MSIWTELSDTLLADPAFGQAGFTYSPANGPSYPMTGILEISDDTSSSVYTFFAKGSDFAAQPQKGDTLTAPAGIDGVRAGLYRVMDVAPEDAGGGQVVGLAWVRQ